MHADAGQISRRPASAFHRNGQFSQNGAEATPPTPHQPKWRLMTQLLGTGQDLRTDTLYAVTAGGMGPLTVACLEQELHALVAQLATMPIAAMDADAAGEQTAACLAGLAAAAGEAEPLRSARPGGEDSAARVSAGYVPRLIAQRRADKSGHSATVPIVTSRSFSMIAPFDSCDRAGQNRRVRCGGAYSRPFPSSAAVSAWFGRRELVYWLKRPSRVMHLGQFTTSSLFTTSLWSKLTRLSDRFPPCCTWQRSRSAPRPLDRA